MHKCVTEGGGGQKISKFVWRHLWIVPNNEFKLNPGLMFFDFAMCVFATYSPVFNKPVNSEALHLFVTHQQKKL